MELNKELLLSIEAIHYSRRITKDTIFELIETALNNAAKKAFQDQTRFTINKITGCITSTTGKTPADLGRARAFSTGQLLIQELSKKEKENKLFAKTYSD